MIEIAKEIAFKKKKLDCSQQRNTFTIRFLRIKRSQFCEHICVLMCTYLFFEILNRPNQVHQRFSF